MKKIVVAIDGFSACGKSTLAKQIAAKLNLVYVDTGAMYRAVTLFFMNKKVDIKDLSKVKESLDKIELYFDNSTQKNRCILNGEDVEDEIRAQRVSENVSQVAAIPIVRKKLVALQREMGSRKSLVMDGRDIGTVVFPHATVKIFLTANKEIRADRRYTEYIEKGVKITRADIISNLESRDHIDSTRKDSPLRVAPNALIIDNSYLSRNEQLELALKIIKIKTRDI